MTETTFDSLQSTMSAGGAEAAFEQLFAQLRAERKYHELFDARLIQVRHRLGLPVVTSESLDDWPEPARSEAEAAYLAACREVGRLLLAQGKFREAWMYLRPAGDKQLLADALATVEPDQENLEDLVGLALHEGISPQLGFQLILDNYGTCNAITTFDGVVLHQPIAVQAALAGMLVQRVHNELLTSVRAHIERVQGAPPSGATLGEMAAEHEWLFENDNYHVDTSHLAAAVRFARLIDDRPAVRLALELTEYGRRLSKQYQFPGEEPFRDVYPSHALLFAATVGEQVDEALDYFRQRAEAADCREEGTAAIETYLVLLVRVGRDAEALEAFAQLVPAGVQLSGYAPKMFELARRSGGYERYLGICRERGDLLAFTAGLVAAGTPAR